MATIYVIRHGQASFGAANYDQLSPLGHRQAEVTGQYFRDCGISFDAAYSGDLQRQRKTAELVLAAQSESVSHTIDPRFNEVNNDEQVKCLLPALAAKAPKLQALLEKGLSESKDYQKVIEAVFNHWVSPACSEASIQSWADYSEAASAALASVIAEQGAGKTTAIFTSGGTIATLVSQVLGLSGEQIYQMYEPVINCSVTRLFYNSKKVSLSYFNDHSFLDLLGHQKNESLVTYR